MTQPDLVAEARALYRAGLQAQSRGDRVEAEHCLLQAAEKLFLAARQARGTLRETRKRLAQDLLEQVEATRQAPTAQRKVQPSQPLTVGTDDEHPEWLVHERPDITFADVAGLETVKEQIRLRLVYPFTDPELAAEYGMEAGGGILLYGPPGTGKTMIARAVAGEMEAAFFAIKPSSIMSQWVGKAEQNLAQLFAEANSYPLSVIFIDELESLSPKRRSSGSTVMQRLVPQLLAEMDGFEKRANPMLFLGATNEPWSIDSAMLRPGRLDRLIYVSPPDEPARLRILELNMRRARMAEGLSLQGVAARTQGFSGADLAALAYKARELAYFSVLRGGERRPVEMADFEAALVESRSSIDPRDLERFERYAGEK